MTAMTFGYSLASVKSVNRNWIELVQRGNLDSAVRSRLSNNSAEAFFNFYC